MVTHGTFSRAAALTAALLATPLAAHADLGEFTWHGREGSGRLVWDLDAVDSDPGANSAAFLHGVVSFDFWGSLWGQLGSTIHMQGTGGSYTSSWVKQPPEVCFVEPGPCESATMAFNLGSPIAGDPAAYTLHVSTLFVLDEGRFPIPLPSRDEDYRWLNMYMTNNVDDQYYLVFDVRSSGETRQIATPVPEPVTWALFAVGAALVGATRRRQGAADA